MNEIWSFPSFFQLLFPMKLTSIEEYQISNFKLNFLNLSIMAQFHFFLLPIYMILCYQSIFNNFSGYMLNSFQEVIIFSSLMELRLYCGNCEFYWQNCISTIYKI